MKTRSQPSAYPALPFHLIRVFSLISALVVSGILSYFCYQLKHDGYKLPWTFLIMLAASLLTLIGLLLTSTIHCFSRLSPLFNMIINIPLSLIWTVGMVLLVWNMYGTLGHTCSKANWASDDGMMICRIYKALFAFVVIGWLVQVALIVLDVRARRAQNSSGVYDKMDDATREVKMDHLNRDSHSSAHDIPYGIDTFQDRPAHANQRFVPEYETGHGQMRMGQFGYQAPPQQNSYDSGSYGYHERR